MGSIELFLLFVLSMLDRKRLLYDSQHIYLLKQITAYYICVSQPSRKWEWKSSHQLIDLLFLLTDT